MKISKIFYYALLLIAVAGSGYFTGRTLERESMYENENVTVVTITKTETTPTSNIYSIEVRSGNKMNVGKVSTSETISSELWPALPKAVQEETRFLLSTNHLK